ncbi:MAG: response regulator transcription factor [Actinomycetota bacterium]
MATILIVDDDEVIRKLVSVAFERSGHSVSGADGGDQALESISQSLPDLVILDVTMPGMDGWEVLRRLRKTGMRSKIKVILLTGSGKESDFLMAWKLGADEYVTKPFDVDELVSAATETLAMSHDELQQRRAQELEKANFLSRIESAFGQD